MKKENNVTKKKERQEYIKELLGSNKKISDQKDILRHLKNNKIEIKQPTLSKDLKELSIRKVNNYYILKADSYKELLFDKLKTVFSDHINIAEINANVGLLCLHFNETHAMTYHIAKLIEEAYDDILSCFVNDKVILFITKDKYCVLEIEKDIKKRFNL